ncbi:hypothetical protein IZ6_24890 [Terrihabitans soli]|uniref:Uncharacterized protein n=1 Tax=Terrihabitans soli TaxID=708113 RepID=A0A6S6QMQ1_9HYPH|nr:hypothetical protein [Terrihabitans soli]BCJ91754.1 hypothetical protein IZ6_24890 [Terrihabitans soli]
MLSLFIPFARHALQFGFGILTAKGVLSADDAASALTQTETVIGALGSIVTYGTYLYGLYRKYKASKVTA